MKKISFYLAGLCLSIVFMTSCLKGSNVWEGYVYGVIESSMKNNNPVLRTTIGDFYSPSLVTLIDRGEIDYNDCCFMYVRIDNDLPENSPNAVAAYGYQTVTIIDQDKIPKYNMNTYGLADTSKVLYNEVPIVNAYLERSAEYVASHFFFGSKVMVPESWDLAWDLSYDPATILPTIEGEKRYYDLYLRAFATKKDEKTNKVERSITNVFYVSNYFFLVANAEKALLGSSYSNDSKFTIRLNFPSSIDESTNTITWSSDLIENISIAPFLETSR